MALVDVAQAKSASRNMVLDQGGMGGGDLREETDVGYIDIVYYP